MRYILKCDKLVSERSKMIENINQSSTVFNLLEENSKLKSILSRNDHDITGMCIFGVSQLYQHRLELIKSS